MPKYNRIKPVEAFQVPRGWEDQHISKIYEMFKEFEEWGLKNGLEKSAPAAYAHEEIWPYWTLVNVDCSIRGVIEIVVFGRDRTSVYATPGDWVVHEWKKVFSVWPDDDFRQQYKPEKK